MLLGPSHSHFFAGVARSISEVLGLLSDCLHTLREEALPLLFFSPPFLSLSPLVYKQVNVCQIALA